MVLAMDTLDRHTAIVFAHRRLARAIFFRALLDVAGKDAKARTDALLFLESSGAADLAESLDLCHDAPRRLVRKLTGR